jgi:hypothetical protein
MRSTIILLSVLPFLASMTHPSQVIAGPGVAEAPYHIALSRQALRAGEEVEMKLLPPVPAGVRVHWPEAAGKTNLIYSAIYRAPYVIPPGTPPVTITVGISGAGVRSSASTEITLLPSSVPGSEDCLGSGQSFSTTSGTIVPDYTFADELPELIHTVAPEYPRSAEARGVKDMVPVIALVCRTGHVLDAYSPPTYRNPGDLQPIEHDPKLVEVAIAAVRQYVFKPALKSGQAIAVWLTIPVPVPSER